MIYGKYEAEIEKILGTICIRSRVEIIEANAYSDDMYMVMTIPHKIRVSKLWEY